MTRAQLERRLRVERELARRRADRPLERMRWLPGQLAFLTCEHHRKLFRSGSQAQGKTTAGAAETCWRLQGNHPFRAVRPPPVRIWAVSGGGEQSSIVQERVWSLVDKSMVAPGFGYDTRKGAFLGKYPRLRLKNGSEVLFKSGQQDTLNLASGTVDAVWIDEPPESERVLNELVKRVLRTNGDIYATLTPVNRDVAYLRKLCVDEVWRDLHFDFRPEHLRYADTGEPIELTDGTVCDEAWLDQVRAETPAYEAPVTLDGEWEFRAEGAYFDGAWDGTRLVRHVTIEATDRVILGIDHGDRPGKQVAVLLVVDDRAEYPTVGVLDLYRDTIGLASPVDDARGILEMLDRNGVPWSRLHFAGGDRVHLPGDARQKSNRDLAAQLKKLLKLRGALKDDQLRPEIRTIKRGEGRGRGSLSVGSRWLFHAMVAGRFVVDPRAAFLLEALPRYTFVDDDTGYKDVVDAIRYGLDQYIFKWARPNWTGAYYIR